MTIRRSITIMLVFLLMAGVSAQGSFAQTVTAVHDNGTGDQYGALDTNYVHITDMDISHAEIESGSGYAFDYGWIGVGGATYKKCLFWEGTLPQGFGSANTTNDSDASLKKNSLPDLILRYPDGAALPDGTVCDVKMTLSDIKLYVGKSRTSRIDDDTRVMVPIACGWSFCCASPKTTFAKGACADNGKGSGATTAIRFKAAISIVDCDTDTPVSSAYPTMLVEFRDLDVRDRTVKKSASDKAKGNGAYAEGIELAGGWIGNAVLGPDSSDICNTCLVDTQTTSAGNTKIKVNGAKIADFVDVTGSAASDNGTLWSGFVSAVKPQGFSFYWTGSVIGGDSQLGSMGTQIGGQPTVAVKAMRTGSGADVSSLGSSSAGSGLYMYYSNTHLMNSSASYEAYPGEGYYLKSLKVDDTDIVLTGREHTDGAVYTFERLNKYPLPERDMKTGQILEAQSSGFYTIEADFAHMPEYTESKAADKASVPAGYDGTIKYVIRCDELHTDAAAGVCTMHDDLAGGILRVDPGTITCRAEYGEADITSNDEDGDGYADSLDISFATDEAPGSNPKLIITYEAAIDWDRYDEAGAPSIVNTLSPGSSVTVDVTNDICVTKTVRGSLRDETKKFEFEVALSGLNKDETYSFELLSGAESINMTTGSSDGTSFRSDDNGNAVLNFRAGSRQGFEIKALPAGCTYKVTEAASDHTASYAITSDSADAVTASPSGANAGNRKELSTAEETLDAADGTVTIAFTNTRNAAAVTGVPGIYGAALAVAGTIMAGAAILIIRRRREAADEEGR